MGNQASLGRYEIDVHEPIGRGAFGAVFVGKDKKTGTRVAVKQCKVSSDQHGTMAMDEIKTYQRISGNKHLVELLDFFFKDSAFWIVMEFCDQGDLEDHMKTFKPDLPRMVKIMHQCASALAYMHGLSPKAVHRDIKPNNILFKNEKGELVLKLADFGLAKVAEEAGSTMKLQTVGGTLPFMAPEIFLEQKYNESVDVFALGLVILAMITFKPTDENLIALSEEGMKRGELMAIGQEMARAIQRGHKPPPALEIKPIDSGGVKQIKELVLRMANPNPKERPPINAVCKELEKISLNISSGSSAKAATKFTSNLAMPEKPAPGDSDSSDEDEGYSHLKKTVKSHMATSAAAAGGDSTLKALAGLGEGLGNQLALLALLHLAAADDDDDDESQFHLGDRVLVENDEQKVKAGQQGYGGWIDAMAKYLGEEGTVQGRSLKQVEVMFHDGNKFNYNPKLLTKLKPGEKKGKLVHGPFKRLEIVRIKKSVDAKQLEALQKGHGGYNKKMEHTLGLRGVVHKIDKDGDIVVEFMSGEKWCLNPDALETVDMSGAPLEGGDLVIVLEDREVIRELQKDHGEWIEPMAKCLGRSGIVKKASPEKVVVEVGDKDFIWNPKCLRLVAKSQELVLVMLKKQLTTRG